MTDYPYGSIIPTDSILGDNLTMAPDCKVGESCLIGDNLHAATGLSIGNYSRVGNHFFTAHANLYLGVSVEVGNHANLGVATTIGNYCQFGDNTSIGYSASIGNYCKFGNNTKIGPSAYIGNNVTVGNNCEIGANSTIGRNFQHGANLTLEGVLVRRFLTMANVDGSGRSILIVVHPDGILVRAGCFVGSLNKFCLQAEYQSKHVYSAVVRAAAEALERTC